MDSMIPDAAAAHDPATGHDAAAHDAATGHDAAAHDPATGRNAAAHHAAAALDPPAGADSGTTTRPAVFLTAASGATIRVVLVDDEALVRTGLRLILGGDRTIEIVGEAADGIDAASVVGLTNPDVVLMDIRMPRQNGLDATQALLAKHPDLKIIVLTTFDTDDMVLSALRFGASGFLLKDTPPEELVDAVRQVAEGRSILSPSVTDQLIDVVARGPAVAERTAARERLAALTDREREIALEIARGRSNNQIAETLHVSIATVKTHIGRVFDKLGAENRVQVVICVHSAGY